MSCERDWSSDVCSSDLDPGPYPIPPDAPIEGGSGSSGDRHALVIDRDSSNLYEVFSAYPIPSANGWTAGPGASVEPSSDALRPASITSADAAERPTFPRALQW